jgi:hypothetical protein
MAFSAYSTLPFIPSNLSSFNFNVLSCFKQIINLSRRSFFVAWKLFYAAAKYCILVLIFLELAAHRGRFNLSIAEFYGVKPPRTGKFDLDSGRVHIAPVPSEVLGAHLYLDATVQHVRPKKGGEPFLANSQMKLQRFFSCYI